MKKYRVWYRCPSCGMGIRDFVIDVKVGDYILVGMLGFIVGLFVI